MNKFFSLPLLMLGIVFNTFSQKPTASDTAKVIDLSEVVVKSTRATEQTGMAFTTVRAAELRKQNLGQDMPFLLNQLPSVVVTSDAGAGVGYTGIRIRGTDPTRINVTVNGVPYNDSESQGVYWVNMPDFASSVASVQVQRGVGTSTNGAGAFGASINVNTLQLNTEPMAEVNVSAGSFNTLKTNVLASTGLLSNGFVVDARLSKIGSDGFVDRASSDLKSFYLSGGYYSSNNFVRLNVFSGKEKTYQSWYGVPEGLAKGNRQAFDAYVNRNYLDEATAADLWKQGRTYNFYTYDNEVDDYQQDHYQLISSWKLGNWRLNPTLHYTYGRGFYEQAKNKQSLADYGLGGSNAGVKTDLIRQKWLNNHFYGGVFSADYEATTRLTGSIGGGWNYYDGDHFGKIIWAKSASVPKDFRWYDNVGRKSDFNIYGKLFYQINSKVNTYVDLQYRRVGLSIDGTADALQRVDYQNVYNFFNPKVGINYQVSAPTSIYASVAVGSKEPNRTDFVDTAPNVPKPERLYNLETGVRHQAGIFNSQINGYYMHYINQLVLTGAINGVGESIRTNVPTSYRMGIELQTSANISSKFALAANLTLSDNRIKSFTETIVSYDDSPSQINNYSKTAISFSPRVIAGGQLAYRPTATTEIALLPKFVGKQYFDNTQNESRRLDSFFVTDARFTFSPQVNFAKNLTFSILVNNVFNEQYESNGYTYSYIYGGVVTENFVFPQAGINVLSALRLRF